MITSKEIKEKLFKIDEELAFLSRDTFLKQEEKEAIQELCPHNEGTYTNKYYWRVGSSYNIKCCNICNKILKKDLPSYSTTITND